MGDKISKEDLGEYFLEDYSSPDGQWPSVLLCPQAMIDQLQQQKADPLLAYRCESLGCQEKPTVMVSCAINSH